MMRQWNRLPRASLTWMLWAGTLLALPAPAARAQAQAPGPPPPATADDLPSTVSPAIARFVRENGLDRPGVQQPGTPAGNLGRAARRDARPGRPVFEGDAAPFELQPTRALDLPPLDLETRLRPAPLDTSDLRFPISLATVLKLSDARPLIVAAAQSSVWVAEAQLTRAKVLWMPTVNTGVDYIRHDGGGPDFNKGVMTAPSVNYFMGGTSIGLFCNVTDAFFEPLAARQMLNASQWDIQTAKNDALLQAAQAYFHVHQHRGRYTGVLYAIEQGNALIEMIDQLSHELVPTDEVARARNMVSDLEQLASKNREDWRVASADLTQVLRLDPRAVIVPTENDHLQVTLVDPARTLDDLLPIALANRPELGARLAVVQAAEIRVRREKMRPFLPIVAIDGFQHAGMHLQVGFFGLGPNSSLNQFVGRSDISLQLMWQLEAFGVGNLARIKQQRGEESRAIIDLRQTQDRVAGEVLRALARVQSAAARTLEADRALRAGLISFKGHLEGLSQTRRLGDVLVLVFRPQEAVYSLDRLNTAFDEYYTTVAEYNLAQFELFHVLGYPAQELSALRYSGEVLDVDLSRPGFLPPVRQGAPPATR